MIKLGSRVLYVAFDFCWIFANTKIQLTTSVGDKSNVSTNIGYDLQTAIYCCQCDQALTIGEELGDKAEKGRAHGNFDTIYFNIGQYEKAMECKSLEIGETSSGRCPDRSNIVCCPNASEVAKHEVDEKEIGKGKENLRNLRNLKLALQNSQLLKFTDLHDKLDSALELHDKYKIVWAINTIRHSLDRDQKTVDCIRAIGKMDVYDQALTIVKELDDKAEQGRAYNNFGAIFFKFGQYEKANDCHIEHLGVLEELGAKKEMQIAFSDMGHAYRSIGEHQEAIVYYKKALQIARELDDKQGETTAQINIRIMSNSIKQHQSVIGDHGKDLVLGARGTGSAQTRLQRSGICKCVWVLRNNCIPEQITKRLQELLILQDGGLRIQSLNKLMVTSGTVVMVTEPSTHGIVIRCSKHVIKGTCQKLLDAASNEDDARPQEHVACQCNKIFPAIEKVLHGEKLHFVNVKTCQEYSLKSSGEILAPSDAEVVTKVDALTTKMSLIKDRMATLFVSGVSEQREAKYGEIPLNEIQLKELADLRSEHEGALREFIRIKNELFCRTNNAQELKRRQVNSTQSKSNAPTETVPTHEIHQTRENNSVVQEPEETAIPLKEYYPVPVLLNYFSSSLQRRDWNGLRCVLSPHIPENVLNTLPNGNGFFQEFLDRRLISEQNMELLRSAFDQIERIDCVHLIDSVKEGQCLLELEDAGQGPAVSGATGESITDGGYQLQGATGFQIGSDNVKDDRESIAEVAERNGGGRSKEGAQDHETQRNGGGRSKEEAQDHETQRNGGGRSKEEVQDHETQRNGGGRSKEEAQDHETQGNGGGRSKEEAQDHETQGNGYNIGTLRNYENLDNLENSISQKSFIAPVQEAAALCPNPLLLRTNEASRQSRKDGPQEGFDVGNYDKSCKDEIWMAGSHKTGNCESENFDTGSCETDNACNANALSSKNGSDNAEKFQNGSDNAENFQNGSCEAGSHKAGSCNGGSNPDPSSNPARSFRHKGRRRKKRNTKWSKELKFSCEHYDRYCDVQFGCCEEFWACHRCHNTSSKCEEKKLRSRDITKIRCRRCSTVQEFPKDDPSCVGCGLIFADYFCASCQHLTGTQNHPYHCVGCGICRVHEDRSFHCDVCGVCLDVRLLENHICRPDSAHDQCCICFEDAFNGCQILPCSHKIHKDCATEMLKNGITTCPLCRQSFKHKLEHRPIDK